MNSKDLALLDCAELDALKGKRIKLTKMIDDPNPIPVGAMGTIIEVSMFPSEDFQVIVDWDIKRSLNLCCPPDEFSAVLSDPKQFCYQCDKETNWLAPDSRCGDCTRFTPDEIRGDC